MALPSPSCKFSLGHRKAQCTLGALWAPYLYPYILFGLPVYPQCLPRRNNLLSLSSHLSFLSRHSRERLISGLYRNAPSCLHGDKGDSGHTAEMVTGWHSLCSRVPPAVRSSLAHTLRQAVAACSGILETVGPEASWQPGSRVDRIIGR